MRRCILVRGADLSMFQLASSDGRVWSISWQFLSGGRRLGYLDDEILQVLETAATRFQNGLHFTKSSGIFRQWDRRVEVVNAVMFHAEDENVAQGTREEARIPIAALFLGRWCGAQLKNSEM